MAHIYFFLQRLKAEKAEITRFLQKPKIQQAPKVINLSLFFPYTLFGVSFQRVNGCI